MKAEAYNLLWKRRLIKNIKNFADENPRIKTDYRRGYYMRCVIYSMNMGSYRSLSAIETATIAIRKSLMCQTSGKDLCVSLIRNIQISS